METRRHLLVCGCPRSGTTALWRLLTGHSEIVLGLERYVHFSFRDGALNPALFERARFFDLQPGDTFYNDLAGFSPYYSVAEQRFDQAAWIGDKAPPFFRQYETIERNFPDAHVIFILRNIFDVAASYQKRAGDKADETWNADRDFRRAVSEWNDALARTRAFITRVGRHTGIDIVSYEDLFLKEANLTPLFEPLGLSAGAVTQEYRSLMTRSRQLDAARTGDGLNSEQRYYITMNASFDLYRDLARQSVVAAK